MNFKRFYIPTTIIVTFLFFLSLSIGAICWYFSFYAITLETNFPMILVNRGDPKQLEQYIYFSERITNKELTQLQYYQLTEVLMNRLGYRDALNFNLMGLNIMLFAFALINFFKYRNVNFFIFTTTLLIGYLLIIAFLYLFMTYYPVDEVQMESLQKILYFVLRSNHDLNFVYNFIK